MAFEGLVENIKSTGLTLRDKFLESPLVQRLSEWYENQTPNRQRLIVILSNLLMILAILYFPIEHFISSSEFVYEFESKRDLTKTLIRSHREVNQLPIMQRAKTSDTVKSMIENQFKEMNLLPEQIKFVNIASISSTLIPSNKMDYGIDISLNKLNLKQIVNLGHKFQSLDPAIKLKDMILSANKEDGRYIDGNFKLIALNIPHYEPPKPEPEPIKKGKKNAKAGDE
ncbi:MAG: hypothetical protein L6Q37_13750 [Bdellovibrionaceae bacterium]|nr:hypothetical protein [Pseudobdellovibrionaceae bacterium]NUM57268.1 hypothetical protein [Pseudobdellovibrionaceae bacterium]